MNNFKNNLISLRKDFHFSQKQLAEKLNVSTNNVGHWEKGRTEPNIEILIKLSEIFDITIDDLIKN